MHQKIGLKKVKMELNHKQLKNSIILLQVAFLALGIWNIWQQHKFRKLEYELKKHETTA